MAPRTVITETGTTELELHTAEAVRLQELGVCSVTPTSRPGVWSVKDVSRVGTVQLDGRMLEFKPKVPVRSLAYMAAVGGVQLDLADRLKDVEEDAAIPVAFAEALWRAVATATRGGLLKGYRSAEESSTVLRGRWDIARQIKRRPGVPVPAEITFDDFTEDIEENRRLAAALRIMLRFPALSPALRMRLHSATVDFANVAIVPAAALRAPLVLDRRNAHYAHALRTADWILRSAVWTTSRGSGTGSTFLVRPAALFERFVGASLRELLQLRGIAVTTQEHDWRLDTGGRVRMRPDIVLRRGGRVVGVADTKYKNRSDSWKSPPNEDVYQALAYAAAAGLDEAHLIYVADEIEPATFEVASLSKTVVVHGIEISGGPDVLDAVIRKLAARLDASLVA